MISHVSSLIWNLKPQSIEHFFFFTLSAHCVENYTPTPSFNLRPYPCSSSFQKRSYLHVCTQPHNCLLMSHTVFSCLYLHDPPFKAKCCSSVLCKFIWYYSQEHSPPIALSLQSGMTTWHSAFGWGHPWLRNLLKERGGVIECIYLCHQKLIAFQYAVRLFCLHGK